MKQILPLIVITGATASGKTALAIELAKKLDAEIISADSRIVFKDLDIVSAKPSEEEKRGVFHHLIDIKTLDDGLYSAGDFTFDATEIIKNAKKPIILQGGTWFYIKSLLDEKCLIGIGQNQELRTELQKLSNDELYQMLEKKDKARANVIHKNNRDKIIRSIELIEAIGGKLTEFEREENNFEAKWFMPDFEREELYERINLRVDLMVKAGLKEEWTKNKEKYNSQTALEIMRATIGYKEFFELEENIYEDEAEAISKIKQHTRNFAKRQLTFFRVNKEKFGIENIKSVDDILKKI